ncbi:hypothetical protein [Sphingomonas sp. MS122]|uniref:hypothetical protein n=1 Tax=Sphingomonas sp. MS122 TaxID=3412683 RepID=UPI003C2B5A55
MPVFVGWELFKARRRGERWPPPVSPDAILAVRAEPGRILIDITDRDRRSHHDRSAVAHSIARLLAISNGQRHRVIGRIPMIGKPAGNFRYVVRYPLPFEMRREDQRFRHGFDALVVELGEAPRTMSPVEFGQAATRAVEANLEADGMSANDYFRGYLK